MPLILVTNDDGVQSEGIHALAEAMKSLGDVVVVGPLQEASATSDRIRSMQSSSVASVFASPATMLQIVRQLPLQALVMYPL